MLWNQEPELDGWWDLQVPGDTDRGTSSQGPQGTKEQEGESIILLKNPPPCPKSPPPPQNLAIDNEGAPILLLTSKNFIKIPKKTTQANLIINKIFENTGLLTKRIFIYAL